MTKKKVLLLLSGVLVVASVGRASVDPKAVEMVTPDQVKWIKNAQGTSESPRCSAIRASRGRT